MDEETLRLTTSKLAKSLLFIRNPNIRGGGVPAMMNDDGIPKKRRGLASIGKAPSMTYYIYSE